MRKSKNTVDKSKFMFYHTPANTVQKDGVRVKSPRATFAAQFDKDKQEMKFGIALCSDSDQFVRKNGSSISAQRCQGKPITTVDTSVLIADPNDIQEVEKLFMKLCIEMTPRVLAGKWTKSFYKKTRTPKTLKSIFIGYKVEKKELVEA